VVAILSTIIVKNSRNRIEVENRLLVYEECERCFMLGIYVYLLRFSLSAIFATTDDPVLDN